MEIHPLLIFPNYLKLAVYEFPCQQNHGTYAESKNKGDGSFKAKPFEIQNMTHGGKKKKKKIKKITEFNYLIDVDKAKGRKDGRAQHLRTHNGSRVDTY